jgi:hypothetical protein
MTSRRRWTFGLPHYKAAKATGLSR